MTRCSIARRLQRWARVISQNGFLLGTAALTAIVLMQLRPAQAQYTTACPAGLDLSLTQLPEIVSRDGRLKGTIVLADGPRSQVLPEHALRVRRIFSERTHAVKHLPIIRARSAIIYKCRL